MPRPESTASVPARLSFSEIQEYLSDAAQRNVLFLDTLLDRGNAYREHLAQGTPPLLKFEHEVVLDGQTLAEPCNYALLHVVPPQDQPTDPTLRPLVVVDPRAGHGPGIGGFKHDSEVGVALRAGHPVYFVTFRPQPIDGQTLFSVMHAEAQFLAGRLGHDGAQRHAPGTVRSADGGRCAAVLLGRQLDPQSDALFRRGAGRLLACLADFRPRCRPLRRRLPGGKL